VKPCNLAEVYWHSSITLVSFYQTTQHHIPEGTSAKTGWLQFCPIFFFALADIYHQLYWWINIVAQMISHPVTVKLELYTTLVLNEFIITCFVVFQKFVEVQRI
jgi:hypothetical protein